MKSALLFSVAILLILVSPGCKTTKPINIVQPVDTIARPAGELRGYYVHPVSWKNIDPGIEKSNISSLMSKIAEGHHNAVYFLAEGNHEILGTAIMAAHENGLRIFAGFNLPDLQVEAAAQPLPLVKTEMKTIVSQLINNCDIDGLFLKPSGHSFDLIEDIVVEAMLVKPYLIISIVYTGASEYQNALRCLEEGIADLIIPENELAFANPECLPLLYNDNVSLPERMKKITPEQIVGLDFSEYLAGDPGGHTVNINGKAKVTDSKGQIGFITLRPDTIRLTINSDSVFLSTADWSIPYKYRVLSGNSVKRAAPWVEFRRMPRLITDIADFDLLCKTDYPASVSINGQPLKQYKTGIFFNKITLVEGPNRIRATVVTKDSLTVFYEGEYTYTKIDKTRKPFPLWIDSRSVQPSTSIQLLPEDIVRISFQGSKEQDGFVIVNPGGLSVKCARVNYGDYSLYTAEIPLAKMVAGKDYYITLRLLPATGSETEKPFELILPNHITVKDLTDFPMVKVTKEYSRLIYNLGAPRLGGPVRSEVNPGNSDENQRENW